MNGLLAFLVASLSIVVGGQLPPALPEGMTYRCTPCGMSCDLIDRKTSGMCPDCPMPLVATFPELASQTKRGHFQNIRGKTCLILLTDGVQILDFSPQAEIFGQVGMKVLTVATKSGPIRTSFGTKVIADHTLENAPKPDLLILPGGHIENDNPAVLAWIRKAHGEAHQVLSVCNGAFYLASAGLLDGLEATTFNLDLPRLRQAAPKARVVSNKRFVDNGKIVTSAGFAAGIDAAFHILSKYEGVGRAQEVATFLEYDWDHHTRYVRAMLPDRYVRPIDDALASVMVRTEAYSGDQDQWTLKVLVSTELISVAKIGQLIEYQWRGREGWKEVKRSGLSSEWLFSGEDRAKWKGTIEIVPSGKDYRVTVKVARSR